MSLICCHIKVFQNLSNHVLDLLQQVHVCLMLDSPSLDTALQTCLTRAQHRGSVSLLELMTLLPKQPRKLLVLFATKHIAGGCSACCPPHPLCQCLPAAKAQAVQFLGDLTKKDPLKVPLNQSMLFFFSPHRLELAFSFTKLHETTLCSHLQLHSPSLQIRALGFPPSTNMPRMVSIPFYRSSRKMLNNINFCINLWGTLFFKSSPRFCATDIGFCVVL